MPCGIMRALKPQHFSRPSAYGHWGGRAAEIRAEAEAAATFYVPFAFELASAVDLGPPAGIDQAEQRENVFAPRCQDTPVPVELSGMCRLGQFLPAKLRRKKGGLGLRVRCQAQRLLIDVERLLQLLSAAAAYGPPQFAAVVREEGKRRVRRPLLAHKQHGSLRQQERDRSHRADTLGCGQHIDALAKDLVSDEVMGLDKTNKARERN